MLPAGEYHVKPALADTKTVQKIRRTDWSAATVVITNAVEPKDKDAQPKVIFNCYT